MKIKYKCIWPGGGVITAKCGGGGGEEVKTAAAAFARLIFEVGGSKSHSLASRKCVNICCFFPFLAYKRGGGCGGGAKCAALKQSLFRLFFN